MWSCDVLGLGAKRACRSCTKCGVSYVPLCCTLTAWLQRLLLMLLPLPLPSPGGQQYLACSRSTSFQAYKYRRLAPAVQVRRPKAGAVVGGGGGDYDSDEEVYATAK